MKTMSLFEYINDPPDPPTPVAITPVRPCFSMFEGGLKRTRHGPTMFARNGALQSVAQTIDLSSHQFASEITPDQIVHAIEVPPAEVEVALSFLLFISAVVRTARDKYAANCPCVEGEALSRVQALQDLDDTDDPEFGAVAAGLQPAPPRPRLAE